MRVLIVGPDHTQGSIPPYLDVLTHALRDQGATVHRAGSTSLPYDPHSHGFWPTERILTAATTLLASIDLASYDLLSVHFGNLEIEQLLAALWTHRPRPPAVYHAHTLQPTLFDTHIPDRTLDRAVTDGIASMEGHLHFGRYAQTRLQPQPNGDTNAVAWLPTTIPPGTQSARTPALDAALAIPDSRPLISLYGFAAPWKDPATLLAALDLLHRPTRIVLAGPFWDDPTQTGITLWPGLNRFGPHNQTELAIVADYLSPGHRKALVTASDLAVFSYQPHPSFQGSGAIADYLAHGTPVVATDVANMAELVADAGRVVPPNNAVALANALNTLFEPSERARATRAAQQRAHYFTPSHHAQQCLQLYDSIAGRIREAR